MLRKKSWLAVAAAGPVIACTAFAAVTSAAATPAAPPPIDPQSASNAPAPAAVRAWFHYNRPANYDAVKQEVNVPMKSGGYLSCDRYRPGHDGKIAGGKHPGLIWDFWAYGTRQSASTVGYATYYADHGYDVLVCDVAGSGKSPGTYKTWFQPSETRDNYDLIEWLAAQPNSNGKIAQTGGSYGSITAFRVAELDPPHLVTIVPEASPSNIYADWIYPGGIPSQSSMSYWPTTPAVPPASRASTLASFQDNPLYDAFWKQVAVEPRLSSVKVPVLDIAGYFDIFRDGAFTTLRHLPLSTWIIDGPFIHQSAEDNPPGYPPSSLPGALSSNAILEWLDHWTMGLKSAKLPPSVLTSFESSSTPQHGIFYGEWHSYTQWPPAGATAARLYPTASLGLSSTRPAPSSVTYDVNPSDGPSAAILGSLPWDPAVDQTTADAAVGTRAVFTLAPFKTATRLTGDVTLHLRASMSMKDTYFASNLEVVTASGKTEPIETGFLRAELRNSLSYQTPVPANKPVNYTIDLGSMDWKFQPGEQLRITLSGGDTPKIAENAPAGLVHILIGAGTYITYATS
jgi:predicted acyl esterase